MTNIQKEQIQKMRQEGQSYSKIALNLGISENTIKSYCRRKNLGANKITKQSREQEIHTLCKHCGKSLMQGTRGQPKKFCSDNCRREWWKINDTKYERKAFYKLKCIGCGKEFESYGNKSRKFCGHTCYINYRFKKERVLNDTGAV